MIITFPQEFMWVMPGYITYMVVPNITSKPQIQTPNTFESTYESYIIIWKYSQEYFQPKTGGRKIRIFNPDRTNNILIKIKRSMHVLGLIST